MLQVSYRLWKTRDGAVVFVRMTSFLITDKPQTAGNLSGRGGKEVRLKPMNQLRNAHVNYDTCMCSEAKGQRRC